MDRSNEALGTRSRAADYATTTTPTAREIKTETESEQALVGLFNFQLHPTILHPHLASTVSSVSTATRLSIRALAVIVETTLEMVRFSTSATVSTPEFMLNTVLQLCLPHSATALLRLAERGTALGAYVMHSSYELAEHFVQTGFQVVADTATYSLRGAEESVRLIDALFGSTETSRALSAIMGLIKREIYDDSDFHALSSRSGTITAFSSFVRALTAFACLQCVTGDRTARRFKLALIRRTLGPPIQPFPRRPIMSNIARFIRYASAAYGSRFMRIFGIQRRLASKRAAALGRIRETRPPLPPRGRRHNHPNHHSFATHTELPLDSILYSSYTNLSSLYEARIRSYRSAGVHYISVDHDLSAIVLTCRGTLGLSDVLTDLFFHYAEFDLPYPDLPRNTGTTRPHYRTHAGVLQSAQLLAASNSPVFRELRDAMLQYPNYGLVFCGHSLGGGVAAILAILWSRRTTTAPSSAPIRWFVTSEASGLPPNRPIHCYAYGVPCVASIDLAIYCRGLITSIANAHDVVPCLSLGLLHDFKNVATILAAEKEPLAEKIVQRTVTTLPSIPVGEYADWFWSLIQTMRASMNTEKLYPPGDVYILDNSPPTKIQAGPRPVRYMSLYRCLDVTSRFFELNFSRSMFTEHSPKAYEDHIAALIRGQPIISEVDNQTYDT
ncbi:hypothetical protein BJ085DRAFT_21996 [Dimargaris cristalligena]|uniref:sn-1-specific diacylglycerol lipase n=1 Tax=Dimargaris cristalligena TaxID=215637 RepID=A0A4P9ZNU1_9FUNG|nr:hypothetical protein BJ085DRAFT_21996 [Dimargaris cristalligena]|eukprot:RKP33990.1 hypothetical protein BJ085DRAFT_21996 [Dimargaris cristalligena]